MHPLEWFKVGKRVWRDEVITNSIKVNYSPNPITLSSMKHPIKWKIYTTATRVYDWQLPIITYLADKVRDWCYNEDMYYD